MTKTMLIALLVGVLAPLVEAQNLLRNPQVTASPEGWRTWARKGAPSFAFDDTQGHGDATSLRVSSAGEGVDGSWLQAIPCQGGTPYEYSFWFRTREDSGMVSFLAEFTSPDGQYLGQHRREVKAEGTEWTHAEGIFTVPDKASNLTFELWVNLDDVGQGTAWFDDFMLQVTRRPILHFDIVSPLHRILLPGESGVECILRQTNPHADPVTYSTALRSDGTVFAQRTGELTDEARIQLPTDRLTEDAAYVVATRAVQHEETVLESHETIIRRSTPPKVAIGPHRELRVDGRPFFPIGVYWAHVEDLPDVAANGFNCVHAWAYPNEQGRSFFHEAERLGLRVVLEMSDTLRGKTDLSAIEERVQALRGEPALLCYYPVDEPHPPDTDPAGMRDAFNLTKRLDSDHPVMYVQCNMAILGTYLPGADIQAVDPYGPPEQVRQWLTLASEASGGRKPVWSVIGTFPWGAWGGGLPSPGYVRCATYLSLICGAKGILYFAYHFDQHKLNDTELWAPLGKLNHEVSTLAPWLLACEPTPAETTDARAAAATFANDRSTLLLVTNTSEDPDVDARVKLPGFRGEARSLFEGAAIPCDEGVTLRLPAYGTRALELPPSKPK